MKTLFEKLSTQNKLTEKEAYEFITGIKTQQLNITQLSAAIAYFVKRKVSVEELNGFKNALLDLCIPVVLDKPALDVCGTGGDQKNTFNISTISAFVLAAAGVPVAKHGNHGASSVSGSSDILNHFGYKFKTEQAALNKELEQHNITFLHAPLFHPVLKLVAPQRKELGIRTFFNLLGPLVNPARPDHKYIGVYNTEVMRLYNYVLQKEDPEFTLVHSFDGYDEISLTGNFKIINNSEEKVYEAADTGLETVEAKDIRAGASIKVSADIFLKVLTNSATPAQTNVVLVNSAFAMKTYHRDKSIEECLALCKGSLQSNKAYTLFKNLINKN
jgi:anthranilate phosphoribosyltransferase